MTCAEAESAACGHRLTSEIRTRPASGCSYKAGSECGDYGRISRSYSSRASSSISTGPLPAQ